MFNTRLKLENGSAADENRSTVALNGSNLVVRTPDNRAFSENEREFLREVFGLIRLAEETDARLRAFEDRIGKLESENLDLLMHNRTLSEISARDSLTGLYNRWYVMEKIDSEMNRALRHGSPMSLLMLDLDHFKRVNDSFGHSVGDEVLKVVGQVLRESCRVYDVPGRYGGEEFCIILPETRVGNTRQVAERIRSRLASTELPVGGTSITVTASIGVAGMDSVAEEGVVSAAALLDRADRALYAAKHHGRNRVELWLPEAPPSETNH
ncbi:MAG TPA: GGDEF domain-containing protein [Thermoanaerobaculia bacterium]|nr:GGDEF domain-containing protein [Thermoanaerobaculia bacterium]